VKLTFDKKVGKRRGNKTFRKGSNVKREGSSTHRHLLPKTGRKFLGGGGGGKKLWGKSCWLVSFTVLLFLLLLRSMTQGQASSDNTWVTKERQFLCLTSLL
jgi:hypothetical protein